MRYVSLGMIGVGLLMLLGISLKTLSAQSTELPRNDADFDPIREVYEMGSADNVAKAKQMKADVTKGVRSAQNKVDELMGSPR